MTAADFKARFHDRCRTTELMFSDARLTLLARDKQLDLAEAIETVDEGYGLTIEQTTLRATGEGGITREYPLPADSLNRMEKVEAKLNGTDWVRLEAMNENLYEGTSDEASILKKFDNRQGSAFYTTGRKSLFLYTGEIPEDIPEGLLWKGYALPYKVTNWADTTDLSEPKNSQCGVPTTFHSLWLDACVIEWKTDRDKPIALTDREQMYQYRLDQKLLYTLNFNRDYSPEMNMPPTTTDNGFDL